MPSCQVPGCRNKATGGLFQLYKLPKFEEKRQRFIEYLLKHGKKLSEINDNSHICSVHFEYVVEPDGFRHRAFMYPTVPRIQWQGIEDEGDLIEEDPVEEIDPQKDDDYPRITHIIRINLDALHKGDDKKLIEKISKVQTLSKVIENDIMTTTDNEVYFTKEPSIQQKVVLDPQPSIALKPPIKIIEKPQTKVTPNPQPKVSPGPVKQGFFVKKLISGPPPRVLPGTSKTIQKTPPTFKSITLGSKVIQLKPKETEVDPLNIKQEPEPEQEAPPSEVNFRIEAVHENFQDAEAVEAVEVDLNMDLDIKLEDELINEAVRVNLQMDVDDNVPELATADVPETTENTAEDAQQKDVQDLPHKCLKCTASFHYKSLLVLHDVQTHKPPSNMRYKCPRCQFTSDTLSGMIKHSKTCKNNASKSFFTQLPRRKTLYVFACSICAKRFSDENDAIRHEISHGNKTGETCLKCQFCSSNFESRVQLLSHHRKLHGLINEQVKYLCTVCNSSFDVVNSLWYHKRTIHKICHRCNEKFRSSVELNNHFDRVHRKVNDKNVTPQRMSEFDKIKKFFK